MTRRRKVFWFLMLAAAAAFVAITVHDRFVEGPVYHGAPLNVWLRLLDDPSPQTRDKARDAIRHIGPAAVPLISEWLDWKDSLFRRLLTVWVAGGQQRLNFHPMDPKDRRRLALSACDALGPVAQPVIPKLLAIATAPNPELDAPFLIARIGGDNALPALARASAGSNKFIRAGAGVSTELLRGKSASRLPIPVVDSEDVDYYDRLEKYHALVLRAVLADSPAAPR